MVTAIDGDHPVVQVVIMVEMETHGEGISGIKMLFSCFIIFNINFTYQVLFLSLMGI